MGLERGVVTSSPRADTVPMHVWPDACMVWRMVAIRIWYLRTPYVMHRRPLNIRDMCIFSA